MTALYVADMTRAITFVADGGGSVLTTGVKARVQVPYTCTINSWALGADQSGSIRIDIFKDVDGNYPPVVGGSITASAKPSLSTATHNSSSTLTGWTTNVTAGDWLFFNIDSITTCTYATLVLKVTLA